MLKLAVKSQIAAEEFEADSTSEHATFWLNRLRGVTPARMIHSDVYKPKQDAGAASNSFKRTVSLDAILGPLCERFEGYDASDVFIALVSAYLIRTSAETSLSFPLVSPIANSGDNTSIGDGETFAVFCIKLDAKAAFQDVLSQVFAERKAFSNEGVLPVSLLDSENGVGGFKDWTRPLPFAVFVNTRDETLDTPIAKIELTVNTETKQATISCDDAIADDFGEAVFAHLTTLAHDIADRPQAAIGSLQYIPAHEHNTIVAEWNQTDTPYQYGGGLIGKLEEQVASKGDHPAVIFKGNALSYADFNATVNRLARFLRKAGVGADKFVGLCLDRSPEMVIAIWAVLKAGGAYFPLNVEDPPQRLASIIRNSGARVILTQQKYAKNLPKTRQKIILLDADDEAFASEKEDNPDYNIAKTDLAYMIYTSGSTGEPKGVLIEHEAIWNRIVWMQDEFQLTSEDRVLQKTPYTFDVSVWEFLWPIVEGATLVIAEPGGHVVPSYLARLIRQEKVTCVHFVPSVLRLFLSSPGIEDLPLRMVFCSGEALPYELQTQFFSRLDSSLNNLYGPTEAAVDVTFWRCTQNEHQGRMPIGKPIANTRMHILDDNLHPVAPGVPGELYIGGVGLARGYWQKPELTNDRFIADPFATDPKQRLYQTGDVARYLPDGNIEYLGRNDQQVKVNGIRIELGEIESVIRSHAAVQDAAVVAKKNDSGNAQIFAFFVPKAHGKGRVAIEHLREHLEKRLSPQMIPRQLLLIDKMPLSASGKVDRKMLPDPEALGRQQDSANTQI